MGEIIFDIPQLREGGLYPSVMEKIEKRKSPGCHFDF